MDTTEDGQSVTDLPEMYESEGRRKGTGVELLIRRLAQLCCLVPTLFEPLPE